MHAPHRRLALAAIGTTILGLAVTTTVGLPSQAAGARVPAAPHAARASGGDVGDGRAPGFLDARQLPPKAAARAEADEVGSRSTSDQAFLKSLGPQALVDIDPLTGTPRQLGRLDGYLSKPSAQPARQVALSYVRAHLADLGLTSADLSTLVFRQDYVDNFGLHNLSWTQQVDGTPVFGNGLKVKVTKNGQVLDVQGSPVHGLAQLAAAAPKADRVSAAQARGLAAEDVGGKVAGATVASSRGGAAATTQWSNHDYADKVWFLTPSGLRPGWSTYVTDVAATGSYQHVVDAVTGRVLLRRSTTDSESGDAKVYRYYPGAPTGGTPVTVNFYKRGWLPKSASFLKGSNVIAWADINDDNLISANEKTKIPGTAKGAQFDLKPFKTAASTFCSTAYPCTWDPTKAYSWKTNENADVANAFYLANNYHDWLENGPAKFTTKAGNFTTSGGDPVLLNALDGANATGAGLPDGNHIDNANMNTPPDGTPPTMQMYLWHVPGATDAEDPYVPTSGAFDPSVLYHEYTHGLSNRLVVDADGVSTLNDLQAGSMGEAWSDYYAMDYLVRQGFVKDTNKSGEVSEGTYLAGGGPFRTMSIDCAVGATTPNCTSSYDGSKGGYTYADLPTISGSPEVHASGEVWAQTLWDLRKALGSYRADQVITRGMSLSADDPSMLDMRNGIVQADLVGFDGDDVSKIWQVFAHRGMGYFAGSAGSQDTAPAEDFKLPPSPATARGAIGGTVTDPTTGDPVEGAVVTITGQGDSFSDVTDADGHYLIQGMYVGTYQKVQASAPGYFSEAQAVNAASQAPTDFAITRDWAAESGGAQITDFNGADFTPYGCGPAQAIDLSQGTGWGSSTGDDNGTPTNQFIPKHITISLPQTIDISTFAVDPSATCGDGGSASTAGYRIETAPTADGPWTTADEGTFTVDDRGRLNPLTPTAGATGVNFVRLTLLSNQTPDFATNCPDGPYSGCSYTDLSEIAVFGAPTAVRPTS